MFLTAPVCFPQVGSLAVTCPSPPAQIGTGLLPHSLQPLEFQAGSVARRHIHALG